MTPSPDKKCPGSKSPFSIGTYRPCVNDCTRFCYGATDLKPAMAWDDEAKRRVCPNQIPKAV